MPRSKLLRKDASGGKCTRVSMDGEAALAVAMTSGTDCGGMSHVEGGVGGDEEDGRYLWKMFNAHCAGSDSNVTAACWSVTGAVPSSRS